MGVAALKINKKLKAAETTMGDFLPSISTIWIRAVRQIDIRSKLDTPRNSELYSPQVNSDPCRIWKPYQYH